ncbi:MAG: hypothetical protein ACO1O6_15355 [Bacteroidota bacterium]
MKPNYVLNPLFVLALLLLMLNDLYFKSAFSNVLTGKLSDLAGIAVLALFLTAFFPKRKLLVYIFVILAFSFWKSPLSSPLIEFLNAQFNLGYVRVVDYTDLFCLFVLLPFYRFEPKNVQTGAFSRLAFLPLSALTLFAIVATSRARPEEYGYVYVGKEIVFESSKDNFLQQLTAHNIQYKMTYKYEHEGDFVENYELQKFLINSDTIYQAMISLKQPKTNKLVVSLKNIQITDRGTPIEMPDYSRQDSVIEAYKQKMITYFENLKQN